MTRKKFIKRFMEARRMQCEAAVIMGRMSESEAAIANMSAWRDAVNAWRGHNFTEKGASRLYEAIVN